MSSGNPIPKMQPLCSYPTSRLPSIPPETNINGSRVKELFDTYQYYDDQLSAALQKVDALVDQMNETTEDSLSIHLTYAAFALSVLSSVATVIGCKCIYNLHHNQL